MLHRTIAAVTPDRMLGRPHRVLWHRKRILMHLGSRATQVISIPAPVVVIVMGVSGCGKSTIGALLALRLRWEFEDADWFHPPSNIDKMHVGIPLTDEDRWPWLDAVAAWIDQTRRSGGHGVIACFRAETTISRCPDWEPGGRPAGLSQRGRELSSHAVSPPVMIISCREICCTANSRRLRSRDRTRIESLSRSSHSRVRLWNGSWWP